ncbi:Uncharacterised protein [Vibrio cholerae]|nr:Uncharacterised protein [Vibrio cholerae]CSI48679.1 Uncharacterised protein [Vibrio cholerae]
MEANTRMKLRVLFKNRHDVACHHICDDIFNTFSSRIPFLSENIHIE